MPIDLPTRLLVALGGMSRSQDPLSSSESPCSSKSATGRRATKSAMWRHPLVLLSWAVFAGCGPTLYAVHVMPAARAVQQAEEAGAAEHAPYEFYYAREHLEHARDEEGEASHQDAIRSAKIAEEYGIKARDLARRRMREAGR